MIGMHVPAIVSEAVESWSAFYSDHRMISVAIRYLHLAGIVIGGGTAIAADRAVLRAGRGVDPGGQAVLALLARAHRVVIPALAVVVTTGAMMTAADISTYSASPVYRTKMALVAILLFNGWSLMNAERRVAAGAGWSALVMTSRISLVLWLAILLMGTMLTVTA